MTYKFERKIYSLFSIACHVSENEMFIIDLYGLKQIIQKPTRIQNDSETLIDIIATNRPSVIRDTSVIPSSIGDHEMIGAVRKGNHVKFKPK